MSLSLFSDFFFHFFRVFCCFFLVFFFPFIPLVYLLILSDIPKERLRFFFLSSFFPQPTNLSLRELKRSAKKKKYNQIYTGKKRRHWNPDFRPPARPRPHPLPQPTPIFPNQNTRQYIIVMSTRIAVCAFPADPQLHVSISKNVYSCLFSVDVKLKSHISLKFILGLMEALEIHQACMKQNLCVDAPNYLSMRLILYFKLANAVILPCQEYYQC